MCKYLSKISALLKIINKEGSGSSDWRVQEFKELRLRFKYIIIALQFKEGSCQLLLWTVIFMIKYKVQFQYNTMISLNG